MQYFHVFHLYNEVFKIRFNMKKCSRRLDSRSCLGYHSQVDQNPHSCETSSPLNFKSSGKIELWTIFILSCNYHAYLFYNFLARSLIIFITYLTHICLTSQPIQFWSLAETGKLRIWYVEKKKSKLNGAGRESSNLGHLKETQIGLKGNVRTLFPPEYAHCRTQA